MEAVGFGSVSGSKYDGRFVYLQKRQGEAVDPTEVGDQDCITELSCSLDPNSTRFKSSQVTEASPVRLIHLASRDLAPVQHVPLLIEARRSGTERISGGLSDKSICTG